MKRKYEEGFADIYCPGKKDESINQVLGKFIGAEIQKWSYDRTGEHLVIETTKGDLLICSEVCQGAGIIRLGKV